MILAIDASRANKKERTGVEWYSYFLIQEFKKLIPADMRVILYMQEKPRADFLPLPQNWEIKILRWPFRFWTIFRLSAEMLLHKPGIFFSPANILPFFTPKKTFTTIHDIGFKRFPKSYPALEKRLQNFGVKRALKKSAMIFTPSEFTKQELTDVYKMYSTKIIITPLGHFAELLTTVNNSANDILEKYNIKKPYFLFLGRKENKKNIDGIIKAFKIFQEKSPNHSLVIAGPQGKLPATSCQLPTIINLDWINSDEKQALLQNAEALLFPSLYEGFGLPILEAFNANAPVITSNCASMPEVAGNAALLVNPKNTQEIINAMKKIVENPDIKNELIQKGKERLKNFSWEKCANQTIKNILT